MNCFIMLLLNILRLYFKIHGIHAVQGLGGTTEMMVHTKKTNTSMLLLRLRRFILVGSSLHRDL